MTTLQDEENQKKGLVCVYFVFGQNKAIPPSRTIAYLNLWRSLPVRVAATHSCRHEDADEKPINIAVRHVSQQMEVTRLCRWRDHVGK
jgi:hypothetical protein